MVDDAVQAVPQPHHVKRLNKSQIGSPRFRARESLVLLKHRGQAPILKFPQHTHETTRPMLATFAVDQHRMVPHVDQHLQSLQDRLLGDRRCSRRRSLLLPLDSELEQLDVLRPKKLQILLRVGLGAQIYDGSELKGFEEWEIGRLREA